ncbi:MAG: translocation/assembly module TamB domain-containing protein [Bryobacteraceae bacterium]|jgi:translocation and assembly module TamB
MKRFRWVLWLLGGAAALLLLAAGGLLVLRSAWLREQVRAHMVEAVETATGGRAEIGRFDFDWSRLRAQVRNFTLHGTEPADRPPLFHAGSVSVGLRLVSIWNRDVDIRYLEVAEPRMYLMILPGGRTNIPEPKVKSPAQKDTIETILALAIGRFDLTRGEIRIENRGATPFELHGANLTSTLQFEAGGPRYRGSLSIQPLLVQAPGIADTPVAFDAAVAMERDRIEVESADLATGNAQARISGALIHVAVPEANFRYQARITNQDAERILRTHLLARGTVELDGQGSWSDAAGFRSEADLKGYGLEYHDSTVRLRNMQAAGRLRAGVGQVELSGLRLAGGLETPSGIAPLQAAVGLAIVRGRDLNVRGIDLALAGGEFQGDAGLRGFDRFTVSGTLAGFGVRRGVALYSKAPLPWDGVVSGQIEGEGSLRRNQDLRASVQLAIAPAPAGAPVHGTIAARYDGLGGVLDLGHSTIALPGSRVDFSGALGRELRVSAETRDLADILPALGESPVDFPIKLNGDAARFDGVVCGKLSSPQFSGHATVGGFSWQGRPFDSLTADVAASEDNASARQVVLARGGWRARGDIALALSNWKAAESSAVFGNLALHSMPLSDAARLLALDQFPVSGSLDATAQITGTLGDPQLRADVALASGRFRDEPFDLLTGRVVSTGSAIEFENGQIAAGAKQVKLTGTYRHPVGAWDTGALEFAATTNAMPVEQIQILAARRPGVKGVVQGSLHGAVEITARQAGELPFRIRDLHLDCQVSGLTMGEQRFGDTHLKADSTDGKLTAHLDSDFAGSAISGDGSWQLEGEYPGSATIRFSRFDFEQLRKWTFEPGSAAENFQGSAEGSLQVTGNALEPRTERARLEVPQLALTPTVKSGLGESAAVHNAGSIVLTYANSVATIESFRLVGKNTDFQIGGRYALEQASPLDLRAEGRVDLSILRELNQDFTAAGAITAVAAVRGTLASPQIAGRVEFQNASFNIAGVPNGISNANGAIGFSAGRASIQSFSGETGGGKIRLSGFAAYENGQPVFRFHANLEQVRLRYPEGVSTVADASLNLSGTEARSMLSGTVTVLRSGFNPQSDFSSVIAQSAEPVETPAARTGFLGGLNFDVAINTSPNVQVRSSLTQDLEVSGNLHLRGTASNPALLGRINVSQGQVVFFGTKYNVSQGSISFFNPLNVEPILDIDLDTRARGIDVTLNISGPVNKLTLAPRSDPPLEFNEIVALLATGRTPTSDPALLSQQSIAPQSWQQTGASALLGQAIASPVTGRLQRFFGVSQLRIDPSLPGLEYNPQARLTLEQQVTSDITFTYITDVTSSNPEIVSVEWAFSKKWSAVAQREENGMIGMDIFFKKRF